MRKHNSIEIVNMLEEKKGKTTKLGHFIYENDGKTEMSIFYLVEIRNEKGEKSYAVYTMHDGICKQIAAINSKNQIKKASGVEFNEELMKSQVQLYKEIIENGETNGGDGRSLGASEHKVPVVETQQNKKNKDSIQNNSFSQKSNEEDEKGKKSAKLKNLREEGISKENRPLVRLNTIINGYYLWQILGIEEKLKGRLPEGVEETSFRYGYLTIIEGKEQQVKDHLEPKDKFAICTSDGNYIIELDETILKPKDMGTKDEQINAQKSAQKVRDGINENRFKSQQDLTYTDITRTALYEIPDVKDRFRVSETWSLSIDRNLEMERGNVIDSNQYRKEITFVQQSLGESTYDKERNNNTLQNKLETTKEEAYQTRAEKRQQNRLEEFDPSEAMNARKHNIKVLADKCRMRYSNVKLDERFGGSLEKFIEIKKNEGLSDKEVMKEVGYRIGEVDKGRTLYDDIDDHSQGRIPGPRYPKV